MRESRSADGLRVVNLSEMPSPWNWVGDAFGGRGQQWRHASCEDAPLPAWMPRRRTLARLHAAWQATRQLGDGPSVLVSHGPRPAMYGALLAAGRFPRMRHLAFSFNFTQLPTGIARRVMAQAFRSVERFVVFSTLERDLYAGYFGLPAERIDMLHWGVQAPQVDALAPPLEHGDYFCALGSQGRDYATLLRAMQRLPQRRLVMVATPGSLAGLNIPANVTVRTGIPLADAMNILAHCRFLALPLAGSEVPCGHVTIVSAMHLGKAVIATASSGLDDYAFAHATALTCPAYDDGAWENAIETLYADPALGCRLGLAGRRFAQAHCSEQGVVEYFARFLQRSEASSGWRTTCTS